jgi:short-chain fatty acids transporter
MDFLGRIALALTRWTERWVPSSFVIAILLTFVIFLLAVTLTPSGSLDCVRFWGDGFWSLLTFGMQMTLIMVSGYLVAVSPPVDRLLSAVARLPRGPRTCVAWMAFLSMTLALLHWGLSIVVSAVMVKRFARHQPDVDYRLLVTAAYLGLGTTWHAGLSASAPLLVATPGHFLEEQMGVIPLTETIFSPFNLILAAVVVVVFTFLIPLMHPARGRALTVDPALLAEDANARGRKPAGAPAEPGAEKIRRGFAQWIDDWPGLGWIVATIGLLWLILHFAGGGSVTLNVVNFAYLMLGIGLHGRASSIVVAVENGVRLASGVILQFPFYAGMFGIIRDSGLTEVISNFFVTIANGRTYPALVYWYSGIVNYFVPSGGSKWAIEAPYVVEAAKALQVKISSTVLAYSWGDMLTNIIQPFWALPILRAAGLDFRHILGYALLVFTLYGALVSAAFWLYPP